MKRCLLFLACSMVMVACMAEIPDTNSYVSLSENSRANCYIVNKAGDFKFQAVKGNSTEGVGAVASAEVLWESFGTDIAPEAGEIIRDVSYEDGYVWFSTPSLLNNGNAVIAAKDASGNILWSWHIWVCNGYDPAASAQIYKNKAGTMMDRNLGATSATPGDVQSNGLFYQWGRKDPFLGGNGTLSNEMAASTLYWPSPVNSDAGTGTIAYAVAHPTTFIRYCAGNKDWYYAADSSTDNTRWNSSKTIYDPCPAGWRVPDGGISSVWAKAFGTDSNWTTLSNWDSTTNCGMDFGSTDNTLGIGVIWYPAAGLLDSVDGSLGLEYVGHYGLYWSCTPNDYRAYHFNFFDNGGVAPSGCSYRVCGRSVRCVLE